MVIFVSFSDVGSTIAGACKVLVAVRASEWFFTSMFAHVNGQTTGMRECGVTLIACVRLFMRVCAHVDVKTVRLSEGFVTVLTFVRF